MLRVLSGFHTFKTKSQLAQEIPDNNHCKCATAVIYREAALRLAQWHNPNSHFTHAVTHRDLVSIMIIKNYWVVGRKFKVVRPGSGCDGVWLIKG